MSREDRIYGSSSEDHAHTVNFHTMGCCLDWQYQFVVPVDKQSVLRDASACAKHIYISCVRLVKLLGGQTTLKKYNIVQGTERKVSTITNTNSTLQ
jgi:hypothetical protein